MWSSFDKINVDFSESVLLLCCRTWRRRPRPARKANRSPHLRTLRRAKCLESCLSFTLLLSLPLYLPPLTLDNLGLMDTPALLPLLLLPPPPLLYPNYTKGRMDVSLPPHLLPSPTWRPFPLRFATFALTLLCHRGRMDITSIHWSPSVLPYSSPLFTNAKRSSEAAIPLCDQGRRCRPSPATARPDDEHWPASVTERVNTGDLRLGRGWSRALLWDPLLKRFTARGLAQDNPRG